MSTEDTYLTDEALLNLVKALAMEVATHGGNESELLYSSQLTDREMEVVMKANTFLSAFTAILIQIVERQNPGFAKLVIEVWTSAPIQKLVQLAFADEIEHATSLIEQSIADLEKEINKEGQ